MPGLSAFHSWAPLSPFILLAQDLVKGEASSPLGWSMGGGGAYPFSGTRSDQQDICQTRNTNIECLL